MLNPLPDNLWSRSLADHLISRTSFGGSPEEREELYQYGKTHGVAAAVDRIVDAPMNWAAFPAPEWAIESGTGKIVNGDGLNSGGKRNDIASWLICMIYQKTSCAVVEDTPGIYIEQRSPNASPNHLAGKMLKFYVDHFPADYNVNPIGRRFINFIKYFILLRDHSLGNFKNLVREVSWAPAMIETLNLDSSRKGRINENFAREVMELFTLGVDGGYTEQDILTLAAAMTGRDTDVPPPEDPEKRMLYRPDDPEYSHLSTRTTYTGDQDITREYIDIDQTVKHFLTVLDNGLPVPGHLPAIPNEEHQQPGDPKEQGDQAIDIVLQQATCGRHMAWKLWRYFVEPDPAGALLDELGQRFRVTYNYEVKPLLKDIFKSEEFYATATIGEQIKDPIDLILTATNLMEAPLLPGAAAHQAITELGFSPLFPPNIAGWPEPEHIGNKWMSAGGSMQRVNLGGLWSHSNPHAIDNVGFQARVAMESYPGADLDLLFPKHLRGQQNFNLLITHIGQRLFPFHPINPTQMRTIYRHYTRIRSSTNSEEQSLRELLRLLLSLPEFQMQ